MFNGSAKRMRQSGHAASVAVAPLIPSEAIIWGDTAKPTTQPEWSVERSLAALGGRLFPSAPPPSPEEDEGDDGDHDGDRDRRRAPVRSREAEDVRVDGHVGRPVRLEPSRVDRPNMDRMLAVGEKERLGGRETHGSIRLVIPVYFVSPHARRRVPPAP